MSQNDEYTSFHDWQNDFVNHHGQMPTVADAWQARAALTPTPKEPS